MSLLHLVSTTASKVLEWKVVLIHMIIGRKTLYFWGHPHSKAVSPSTERRAALLSLTPTVLAATQT